jgi:hypothetical protein
MPNVYFEVGTRNIFAAALDWPGWCRMGQDETAALGTLLDYGPRYAQILHPAALVFQPPGAVTDLVVVERLNGNSTTDFGAPDLVPTRDTDPLDEPRLQRLQSILQACWLAFDSTVETNKGKALRTGPRGGGRTLAGILKHVLEAEAGYLSKLGGRVTPSEYSPLSPEPIRRAILDTLAASARGEIAPYGPRGGKRWPPRFFVRREAWHVLDHVWEIEDRLEEPGGAG